ncbi:MATE family efflux transporter [Clostridium sp. D2Q-11]|uniref:Probable multidrug resistance protein NorM n=1 Tax=Anaeromonas frigoriresistens TaxID=2683708 RepID=A0A942UVD9_9FIRM|nr:MATE family efflux transporter [Anaeromonas frigoriresistens]MBS4538740.1 MATE family efflux transporter [Anaeromonas frigoriresistens]
MVNLSDDLTPKKMRKNILNLAWPAALRMFLQSIVGIVDIMMVGSIGAHALATADVSNRFVFVTIGILSALTMGSTALVARYKGAKDSIKTDNIIIQSLLAGFILSIIVAVLGFIFAKDILNGMMILMDEVDPFILTEGNIYLKIVFTSMIFALPTLMINSILQGLGDMKTPLYIMVLTNIVNVLGNYLFIFGIGFLPQLGVTGAALGTGLGRLVGFLVAIYVLSSKRTVIKIHFDKVKWKLDWDIIKEILNIGVPASVEQLVRQGSQIIYTILVSGLGTITIASNALAMNINSLPMMIGFGFGLAATTLVGQSLGAGKEDLATEYGKQTTYITMIIMTIISIPMFIWVEPIIKLYTTNPEVISLSKPVVRMVITIQPIFAIYIVLVGALRGAGDTRFTMFTTMVGNWTGRLLSSLFFGYVLGLGLIGFWIGMMIDISSRALIVFYRFKSKKWQRIYDRKENISKKAA